MRKPFILILLFFNTFILATHSGAQDLDSLSLKSLQKYEESLVSLGKTVQTDTLTDHRIKACDQMSTTFTQALKIPHSFKYPFDSLASVSILYPPDSSFRIFTWQLYVDIDEYRYFGAIQMNSEDLKLFPLNDQSANMEEVDYEDLTADYWYGALYYNIRAFESAEGPKYLLFGYDAFRFFTKRKLIEVLSFKDGLPAFGAPVFGEKDETEGIGIPINRIVLEYTAETAIRLNFDPNLDIIIHDHLISMMTRRGPVMAPDGSYVGYQLKEGKWAQIDKVFHEVSDEAPRPQPILEGGDRSKRRDLFGNNE